MTSQAKGGCRRLARLGSHSSRLANRQWRHTRFPLFSFALSRSFDGGTQEACLRMPRNIIRDYSVTWPWPLPELWPLTYLKVSVAQLFRGWQRCRCESWCRKWWNASFITLRVLQDSPKKRMYRFVGRRSCSCQRVTLPSFMSSFSPCCGHGKMLSFSQADMKTAVRLTAMTEINHKIYLTIHW